MATEPRLFLASSSPRRRELLAAAGYHFEVCPASVDESVSGQLTVAELVWLNARRKARAGVLGLRGTTLEPAVVLGADTLVSLDNVVFGKPRDMEEAFGMLSRLSGRAHEVFTGVCLLPINGAGPVREWVERTAVTFRPLDADGINAYLARIRPLDKAGAYAAQEHGADIIAAADGSWTNVMGLPMESLERELAVVGVPKK